MLGAEGDAVVIAGAVGVLAVVVGSLFATPPSPDTTGLKLVDDLARRRPRLLAGSMLSLTGWTLLLWPVAAVATTGHDDVWPSLAAASVGAAAAGLAFVGIAAVATIAAAWRADLDTKIARTLLDVSHLAIWSVSAPLGAAIVVSTTAVGIQAELLGTAVVVLAAAKVATVVAEIAGTGKTTGWNVGGWALGSSGYVTVAWYGALIVELA